MADKNVTTSAAPRRRRWLRILAWAGGILVVLMVALYFLVTSSGFVTGVILPRVSKSINADVTVTRASVSPFSQVILDNLKVQAAGQEPVLTATQVRLRYSLFKIMGGTLKVEEVTLTAPAINLVQQPDGSSNLDPILRALESGDKSEPKEEKKSDEPTQVEIGKVLLTDGSLRMVRNYDATHRDTTELRDLRVELSGLQNGKSGTLNAGGNVSVVQNPPSPGRPGQLQAKVATQGQFAMSPELKPASMEANADFNITQADGALADLATLGANFNAQITPAEIKQIALRFQRGQTALGEVHASGPLSLQNMEGRMNLEVRSIDHRLLNLFGAAAGLDFGSTTISSTNSLELKNQANAIQASGRFQIARLQVKRGQQITPVLDTLAEYSLSIDRTAGTASIQTLTLSGTQNQKPLWQGKLSSPMTLSWGQASSAVADSAFELALTGLNLAEWKPFLGDALESGVVNARFSLLSQQGGKRLSFEAGSRIENLTAGAGANRIAQAEVSLRGQLAQDGKAQTVAGTFTLANVTGQLGASQLRQFGANADFDVVMEPEVIRIRKAGGKLTQGANVGGTFEISGVHGLAGQPTEISVKLADLNQHGLRPFLEPMFASKQLVSVSLNGSTAVNYNPRGASTIKADVELANLVVTDPQQRNAAPGKPLEAKVRVDASLDRKSASVKQFQVALTPTVRAKNELRFEGELDISQSDAIRGNLQLTAESIDVTPYYDLFAGGQPANTQPAGAPPSTEVPPPASTPRTQEPDPIQLPFRDLVVAARIGAFYLRDVAVKNLQTTLKLSGGRVLLDPFELALNDAPIKARADLDLSVPGFRYDLMFDMRQVPIAPLVDSFSPTYRGRAKGDLTANVQLQGAGTLGANLQRNLAGEAQLLLTNANVQAVGPRGRLILVPIAVGLGIPELADSPIHWLTADAKIASGKINLAQFRATAPAYSMTTRGTVTIASVTEKSTIDNLPVELALSRSMAQQARVNVRTEPDDPYANLGVIAHVRGTVGKPDVALDEVRLALIISQSYVPGEAGQVLRGLGGVLGGGQSRTQTNAPADAGTNAPPRKRGLLEGVLDAVGPK